MTQVPPPAGADRTPWIITAILGLLVLCLLGSVLGIVAYLYLNQPLKPAEIVIPPTVARPTLLVVAPTIVSPVPSPTATMTIAITPTLEATPTLASPSPAATRPPALPTGKIAFSVDRGDAPEDKSIWIMNANGSGARQILSKASSPAFSPDGSKIAFYHWTDGIYVANVDGSDAKKIVGESHAKYIVWSHDGRWIAWSSNPIQSTNWNIDAVRPDGSERRTIVHGGWMPTWSPDDALIIFHSCRGNTCGLFKASSLGGDGLLIIGDGGADPAVSPDGKRIVYQAEVEGIKQLFVIGMDGSGKKQLTLGSAPHVDAVWSLDGNFIFYRSPEGGSWGIWRIAASGANPTKLIDNVPPVDWAFEKLAISK